MQSKKHSLIESVSNTAVGFVISFAAQWVIYPLYGFEPTFLVNLQLVCIFTAISIGRNYVIRRAFNGKAKPQG